MAFSIEHLRYMKRLLEIQKIQLINLSSKNRKYTTYIFLFFYFYRENIPPISSSSPTKDIGGKITAQNLVWTEMGLDRARKQM